MSTGTYDRDEITAHKEKQDYPSSSPSDSSVGHTGAYGPVDDSALNATLYPDDSYTPDGTYWADLPRAERSRFVNKQFTTEWGRELRETWALFKQDPGAPLKAYWNKYVLTGMGLFVEGESRFIRLGGRIAFADRQRNSATTGFVLFSIGNLKSLFASTWPQCWGNNPTVCDESEFTDSRIAARPSVSDLDPSNLLQTGSTPSTTLRLAVSSSVRRSSVSRETGSVASSVSARTPSSC